MTIQVLLALLAGAMTASASIAQRSAAAPAPRELRFSWRLVTYLMHRPVWFLGIACMVAGFAFQLAALHFGDLSLVEPVIASELLFVFAYLAVRHRGRVGLRDWTAAAGMAVSLGVFLYVADPSGGHVAQASSTAWLLAGAAAATATAAAAGAAFVRSPRGAAPSPARKAALLAVSAGVAWGFVAAVIKELASHVGERPGVVLTNWSPYVLFACGAVAMFIVSNAFQAGPLAASQPGLTIMEPLVASLLGITLFGEHIRHGGADLVLEALLLVVLVASVVLLSRSRIVADDGTLRQPDVAARDGRARRPLRQPEPDGAGAPRRSRASDHVGAKGF